MWDFRENPSELCLCDTVQVNRIDFLKKKAERTKLCHIAPCTYYLLVLSADSFRKLLLIKAAALNLGLNGLLPSLIF